MYSATNGYSSLCRWLVEDCGADINKVNNKNETALDDAVGKHKKECAILLKSIGGVCNQREFPPEWNQ